MVILQFLISLMGAVMLLLYAVRMVQTGIERAFGASFQRVITKNDNPFSSAAMGTALAMVLQSSAAVALLTAGFASVGTLSFPAGLAVVLGADFGSAIVVQLLSFRLDWLVPILLAIGGWFFVKTDKRILKQAGRILLGIAFILLSLRFLRETMDPIRDSSFLPAIAAYLESDFLTAFIIGSAVAVLMHSSVAVVLMCVTLVAIEAIPLAAGISLVLGANLGSAVIPVWLTRDMNASARRIPVANLILRGVLAVIVLFAVNTFGLVQYIAGADPQQTVVSAHLAFNALLLIFLPLTHILKTPFEQLIPTEVAPVENEENVMMISALDDAALTSPRLSFACLRREVLRMSQLVEHMMRPVMERYQDGDLDRIKATRLEDKYVNQALDGIRHYVAAMPNSDMSKVETRKVRELAEYAINLETAGDIVAKRLMQLAANKASKDIVFSEAGWEEIRNMHEKVVSNMTLAFDVLISEDVEAARLLMEEKNDMAKRERKSRKKHLKRIRHNEEVSLDSSDLHLETLRALKDLNSQIASIAYPILFRHGQLLETRLVDEIDES
ncbi:MAG: Na/Pi cotransporter family protein [Amylibacter sp.]|nr:Na/Pi cotransporter family protein [Amylibacter sp.]